MHAWVEEMGVGRIDTPPRLLTESSRFAKTYLAVTLHSRGSIPETFERSILRQPWLDLAVRALGLYTNSLKLQEKVWWVGYYLTA